MSGDAVEIRMKEPFTISGPAFCAHPGQRVTVEAKTGKDLVAKGYADEVETAAVAPQETAAKGRAKAKATGKK